MTKYSKHRTIFTFLKSLKLFKICEGGIKTNKKYYMMIKTNNINITKTKDKLFCIKKVLQKQLSSHTIS